MAPRDGSRRRQVAAPCGAPAMHAYLGRGPAQHGAGTRCPTLACLSPLLHDRCRSGFSMIPRYRKFSFVQFGYYRLAKGELFSLVRVHTLEHAQSTCTCLWASRIRFIVLMRYYILVFVFVIHTSSTVRHGSTFMLFFHTRIMSMLMSFSSCLTGMSLA